MTNTPIGSYRPLVGWTNIVFGIIALLPGILVSLVLGGVWGVSLFGAEQSDRAVIGIAGGALIVVVVGVLMLGGSVSIAAGVGVLRGRRWGDVLCAIVSVLNLLNVPIGTAVGGFSLWVLLVREPAGASAMTRSAGATGP